MISRLNDSGANKRSKKLTIQDTYNFSLYCVSHSDDNPADPANLSFHIISSLMITLLILLALSYKVVDTEPDTTRHEKPTYWKNLSNSVKGMNLTRITHITLLTLANCLYILSKITPVEESL